MSRWITLGIAVALLLVAYVGITILTQWVR